jgi:hypothetical protein
VSIASNPRSLCARCPSPGSFLALGTRAPSLRRRAEPPPPSCSSLEPLPCLALALGSSRLSRGSRPTQARVDLAPGAAGTPSSGEPEPRAAAGVKFRRPFRRPREPARSDRSVPDRTVRTFRRADRTVRTRLGPNRPI